MERKAFVGRMKEFFGLKPGQTLKDFMIELKALTDKDKDDLCRWFNEAGMPTEAPTKTAA